MTFLYPEEYGIETISGTVGSQSKTETNVPTKRKHSHYFKTCSYPYIDVYRVLELFGVTDPCIQHSVKKLLVAGGRGAKDMGRDVQEAIDTLERWQEMRNEEGLK